MRTTVVLLLLFCLKLAGHALAAEKVALKSFLDNPQKYAGKEILVSGFLSLEDYGKALFLTQRDYVDGRFENSVPIVASYKILNMREAFHRTFVRIRAVYNHDCAGPKIFCSGHPGQGVLGPILEIRRERLPVNQRPLYRKPAIGTIWDELSLSEAGQPDHEEIMQLAARFSKVVAAENKTALLALFQDSVRKAMEADLNAPASRTNWLLFSGPYSYKTAFLATEKLTILPLRIRHDPIRPPVAAACYCVTKNCAGRLPVPIPGDAVTAGSFVDPYKCIPFHKSEHGWVVDAGFLLSFGEGAPYGNDLGTVMTEDPKTVVRAFTQPPTFSSFSTRLRERPRSRVANALRTGRLPGPIDFVTPSWTLYSMKLENDGLVLEKLEDLGSGDEP